MSLIYFRRLGCLNETSNRKEFCKIFSKTQVILFEMLEWTEVLSHVQMLQYRVLTWETLMDHRHCQQGMQNYEYICTWTFFFGWRGYSFHEFLQRTFCSSLLSRPTPQIKYHHSKIIWYLDWTVIDQRILKATKSKPILRQENNHKY